MKVMGDGRNGGDGSHECHGGDGRYACHRGDGVHVRDEEYLEDTGELEGMEYGGHGADGSMMQD